MKRLIPIILFLTSLTSYAVAGTGILNPIAKWKFKTKGTVRGGITGEGDRLYFGSSDGYLYSVNQNDGTEYWRFQTQGSVNSTPALSTGLVIFSSTDNNIYALQSQTGKLAWKFQMQPILDAYWEWEYFSASPKIANGNVYAGSGDGHLYVLNLSTGKLLWKFKTNGRVRASALVENGKVYQPSNDGTVYVLQQTDGKLLWKFATDGASLDSRKFGFDRTCMFATPRLKDSTLVVASRDGKVYGVNIYDQKEKWRFTYGSTWAMASGMAGDQVFIGWSTNNTFCALDIKTGKEKWKYKSGGVNYTTPCVVDDEVIFGSADEKVYGLERTSGQKRWEYKAGGKIYSSPYFNANTLYFGCDDGYVYAVSEGPKPFKAVYMPISGGPYYSNFIVEAAITPYLKERDFQQLDSASLYSFLIARVADKAPSVIVFAYDLLPTNIVGENPESGLIRQYLNAGGKIIWFGNTPNLYKFDEKGNVRIDPSTAARMLDVEFVRIEESGNYYSKPTQAGLNLGLPDWLTITYATVSEKSVVPLAIDEFGRVSGWMKKYSDRAGSGFISCRTWGWYSPIKPKDLELIHHMAMYGLE